MKYSDQYLLDLSLKNLNQLIDLKSSCFYFQFDRYNNLDFELNYWIFIVFVLILLYGYKSVWFSLETAGDKIFDFWLYLAKISTALTVLNHSPSIFCSSVIYLTFYVFLRYRAFFRSFFLNMSLLYFIAAFFSSAKNIPIFLSS
jgi:hypothetical protein